LKNDCSTQIGEIEKSESLPSDTIWNLKNTPKSKPNPSNGIYINLDIGYHLIIFKNEVLD